MYATEQSKDKVFWLKWLEKYKYLRCLWDVDSTEYTKKAKRKDAYNELVAMAKHIHPEADETFVKARINCFRTAYRKEAKKVLAARENGGCYEPNWFYYNLLNSVFLLDNNVDEIFANKTLESSESSDGEDPFAAMEIKPNIDPNEDNFRCGIKEKPKNSIADSKIENSHVFDNSSFASCELRASDTQILTATRPVRRKFPSLKAMAANFNSIETNHEDNSVSSFDHRESQITAKESELHHCEPPRKKRSPINYVRTSPARDESHIEEKFKSKINHNVEEECDIIGRRIASHFKNMKPTQRLIAERIICDVCIHGRMDQLTWESGFIASDTYRQTGYRMNGLRNSESTAYDDGVIIDPDDYA